VVWWQGKGRGVRGKICGQGVLWYRFGEAGRGGHVMVRFGEARRGKAVKVRLGMATQGEAVGARYGWARFGEAWQGGQDNKKWWAVVAHHVTKHNTRRTINV
jgi:hypothetical protein